MPQGSAIVVGVGPGLGLALARAFGTAGHPVAMLTRDQAKLDSYAADVAATGQDARGYVADAADPAQLRAAIGTAVADLGAPDVLVYNVGILRKDAPTGGDDKAWASVTAANVLGARVAADAVLPQFRDGRGSLLFTGGGWALHPSKEYASLSVGKAALRAYVQTLYDELAGTGVHATVVTITDAVGQGEAKYEPASIAQQYVRLEQQPESEWQPELVI